MTYALVRKVRAARKINIPDPGTGAHEMLNRPIRQMLAVTKMKVMQIFPKPTDAVDYCSIRNVPAFRQNEITKAWCNGDDSVDAIIGQKLTTGEVENAEVLVISVGELKESFVCKKIAVS